MLVRTADPRLRPPGQEDLTANSARSRRLSLPSLLPRALLRKSSKPAPAPPPAQRETLLVVGHGMVAHHLCRRLVELGGLERYRIEVFGEEPTRAYDRVHLSQVVRGDEPTYLYDEDYYEQHGITVRTGVRVEACDLETKRIRTSDGEVPFDKLVFATGSAAIVPKIPGVELPQVTCFRDVRDAFAIRERALQLAGTNARVVIVGAGLLGLEAAHELTRLGCDVALVESATHLLPRQLDEELSARLLALVEGAGFTVHTGARVASIVEAGPLVSVELTNGASLVAGMVLVAAGVRPRDELARDAGLHCDLFGGIEVNDALRSSKDGVYAVGECARHRGVTYGLVAPGKQMADVLARRLMGARDTFSGVETSTRLKIPGLELTVIGQCNVRDPSTTHVAHDSADGTRKLVLRRGKLIGVAALGAWAELQAAQAAVATHRRLRQKHLRAFRSGKPAFGTAPLNVASWPEATTVCVCTGVTSGALVLAHRRGNDSLDGLCTATGAGSVCGTCRPLVASMLGAQLAGSGITRAEFVAVVACALTLCTLLLPAIPHVPSVEIPIRWDLTFSDEVAKQVSGFSLLGLGSAGLALSLRKRLNLLKSFTQAKLRAFHIVIGAFAVLAYMAHTGLRLGANLDRALALVFLGSVLVGGMAALVPWLSRRVTAVARLKAKFETVHLYAVWPLPVLILFHVIKVYFF
jgi:nitrite reductase (NADH) large subunit